MAPWLSIIVPTIGRSTLPALLASIRRQAPPDAAEVLVIGDTYGDRWGAQLAPVPALCADFACDYLPYGDEAHAWGHPQRNFGAEQARGAWLWWLQDDDTLTADAYAAVASVQTGPRLPHLFRVATWQAGVVWRDPRLLLGNVDADGLVAPREAGKVGYWPPEYNGDFRAIWDTIGKWDGAHVWHPAIIACGRPAGTPADLAGVAGGHR